MSEITNTATIRVVADASGVEAGLRQAADAARNAGRAVSEVGAGAATSTRNVEAAQRNIVAAIQRTTLAMEAGGKSTAAYYELLGSQRGVDPAALAPYITQLRAVEQAQARAAQSALDQQAAQQQAAESVRAQAAAQRELSQAQAARDNFVAGLREQVALFGASTEEVIRYRAAQIGAAAAAEPLIAQLQAMRTAQEQVAQAERTSAEAARAQVAAQREAAQAQASRDSFVAGLREQVALYGASTEAVLQYRAAQLGATQEAAHLILQLQNMRAAQEQVTQAARAQAEAQRAAERVQAGQDSFVEGLRQQAEAIGRTRTELLELRAAQLGVSNQAAPFIAQLRAADQGLQHTGMSAAAMSAALRQVPAQVTDIIVGLQGGQAPLTVLLQQGGQLRDMFGSVGGAAKALGGAVLNLINPYTLAIAAAAGLAYAYKTGHDETLEYARALATTNNIAGVTTGQLSDMAREIGSVTGSQHSAAAALAELAATGTIAGANLQKFGLVAVEAQRDLGKAVADTAAEFADLGKSPLSALDKISEKYHFITAATYAQVKAAQDHGQAMEAASIAQNAYADGISKQRQKVIDSLSDWERGWLRIKTAAGGALDAVIDFASGREATGAAKINSLLEDRAKIEEDMRRAKARGLDADVAAYQAELDANERDINKIRDKAKASKDAAAADAAGVRAEELRNKWLGESNVLLTRQQQLERDLKAARTEGAENGLKESEIQDRLTVIRRKYNDVYVQGIDTSITALQRRAQIEDERDKRTLALIAAQHSAGMINDEDALNQTAATELAALDRQKKLLQDQLGLTRTKINSQREQADLEGQIAVVGEQRRTREKQQENELQELDQRRYRIAVENSANVIEAEMAELASLKQQAQAQQDQNDQIGLSAKQVAILTAARLQDAAARKDAEALIEESFDLTGERAARIRDEAAAIRERAAAIIEGADKAARVDLWKQSVDQYGQVFQQGFADMLNNGQAGWSSFTKSLVTTFKTSVADQIYKMFARPIIVQLVGNYLGISPTAISGEIASQPNAYGVTASGAGGASSAIGAAQAASTIYKAISGGFESLSTSVADAVQAGMYQTGLTTQIASNGAFATGAGAAAGYGAGLIGGHYIGNAIAGDYSVAHGQTVTNIASIAGAIIGGPIGGAIGGAIGGLINRAFGMGSTEVQSQGLKGTLSATSLTGEDYQNLHQDGGWFRSDKDWTDGTPFDAKTVAQFTQGLQAIESASSGFASSLGVSADWIKDYSKAFDIVQTGDATKDAQAIADFFTGIGDEIAKKLVPNLDDFSKSGETASATLERLAGDFKGTDQVAQLLGFSAEKLFGSTGLDSAAVREQFIDMAGGLSALNTQAAFFNQNFLTDAERIAPVAAALDTALASLGLDTIPTTRDQFKGLVNSLIASGAAATESGGKQLESLLALGEAFAQVHPDTTADDAQKAAAVLDERKGLQDQLDELTMSSTQLLAKQRDALDESNRGLFDQIQGLKAQAAALQTMKDSASTLLSGVDSAFLVLQKVVDREKKAVQTSVDAHTAAVARLQSLSEALHSTLDSMKSVEQVVAGRAAAKAEIGADLAITKAGGSLSDAQIDSLKKALSAASQDASSQFGSYNDYLRDLYQTQNDIGQLAGVTDDSLSVEQKALKAAQDQLTALDQVISNAQDQIDILKGIDTNGLTLIQAMEALSGAILSAQSNPIVGATAGINSAYQSSLGRAPDAAGLEYWQGVAAGGTSISDIKSMIAGSAEAQVQSLYQSLLGRTADAAGLNYWLGSGESSTAMTADIMQSDEYKKLHPFAIGINSVPEDMPALLHKGERVMPAADNRAVIALLARASSGGNRDASAAENAWLRRVMDKQQKALDAIAQSTGRHADMFDTATAGGNAPMLVEIA